ncbi:putative dehydrogenase [Frankia sp. EI5c]|uniref:Gfo/Idh/MocA family protein n=1 Tax=Frankia sp. EI5c TaxID=683316 RepID=UPI0007C3D7A3|nr:Gfo/Idh/MocA family oxidoreductase [Frankia sp. EI5c]OAA28266.1 putative dehydrogenase [Frankia sp. EI5c]
MPRIHLVSNLPGVNALGDHLRAAGLGPTSARSADALLVLIDRPLDHVEQDLLDRARQSVPVLLAGPTVRSLSPDSPLIEASGLTPGRVTPAYELRLLAGPDGAGLAARLGSFAPRDSWIIPDKVAEDVERLLMVRHEMGEHPICTWRPATGLGVFTLGNGQDIVADPRYQRLVGRWLRHALGASDAPPVKVGLVGAPDVFGVHIAALGAVEGLDLAALCDGGMAAPGTDVDRLARRVDDPDDLVNDPELGLIVVATPTHTHVEWARRALEAGKQVVVHPPICLSTPELDELTQLAASRSRLLAAYPEGLVDPAHQAMRAAVRRGDIGGLMWVEVFAGGLRRPAGTWHDDERISGGLLSDRGTALLEQVLDLVDDQVEWVSAAGHKRVWHHVSNADHARVLLRFAGGCEAQVTISDVAAGLRSGSQLVGTEGTLLRSDRPRLPAGASSVPADDPPFLPDGQPLLVAHDGRRTTLPTDPADPARFHRELADHLVSGWPLANRRAERTRLLVSVLDAARRSAAAGGAQVAPA